MEATSIYLIIQSAVLVIAILATLIFMIKKRTRGIEVDYKFYILVFVVLFIVALGAFLLLINHLLMTESDGTDAIWILFIFFK